ncbi:MAG: hypothetical protein KF851_04690 [Pirellulaceae bacterium]|nr:hypothetical protein [Pirellulaceae bacterium]
MPAILTPDLSFLQPVPNPALQTLKLRPSEIHGGRQSIIDLMKEKSPISRRNSR